MRRWSDGIGNDKIDEAGRISAIEVAILVEHRRLQGGREMEAIHAAHLKEKRDKQSVLFVFIAQYQFNPSLFKRPERAPFVIGIEGALLFSTVELAERKG
jgi:hypothetical protein